MNRVYLNTPKKLYFYENNMTGLPVAQCPNCNKIGTLLEDIDIVFCPYCGQALDKETNDKKQDFIETFAHFMTEHDLNEAYDSHFKELGHMNYFGIVDWLSDILKD